MVRYHVVQFDLGIVVTKYGYVLQRSSNSPPFASIRTTSIFQRCEPNPTGALVSRAIAFEYKIHLVLSPL